MREAAEYILPLRWTSDAGLPELTAYLRTLHNWIDITVVDGSAPELFAHHAAAWRGLVRHLPVAARPGLNGKALGVLTGLRVARHDAIIIADDDVRYERHHLREVLRDLCTADLVRPQNVFDPCPWHASWDTARSLINRGFAHDYPGTYAVRREVFIAANGYDAGVLFENLELERTIVAVWGTVRNRPDILIPRKPPTLQHFFSQRIRHAYDSLAQPARLIAEVLLLPLFIIAALTRPWRVLLIFAGATTIAERGRRRNHGHRVSGRATLAWVPVWIIERSVTIWCAIALRLFGGVRYGDTRIRKAANSVAAIRRRIVAEGFSASPQHSFRVRDQDGAAAEH